MAKSRYEQLGASASKAGLHNVLKKTGLSDSAGLFASIHADWAKDPLYASFLHCDGAGTKTLVAYLMYRETGDTKYFAGLAQDALVMNLDDVYCLGTPESMLLSNLVARNAKSIGDDVLQSLLQSYKDIVETLNELGIDLTLGGGETADCGDLVPTLMVDAVLGGRVRRNQLINPQRIAPGDIIIGLSSTGQSSYEQRFNSGIGSNGLTLARHSLLSKTSVEQYPEVFAPALGNAHAYTGPYAVTDNPPSLPVTIGEALLSPTRTYAPVLKAIYQELEQDIHGVIHCTGGGQTKVLRFGQNNHYVKNALFPAPPLFELIQKTSSTSWKEMYQVFNMGHRMEVYCEPRHEKSVVDAARQFKIDAKIIGYVEQGSSQKNSMAINSPYGEFEYFL